MSVLISRALLQPRLVSSLQFVRYRKRINFKRPAKPHYERAKVLEVCKPFYIDPRKGLSLTDLCEKSLETNPIYEDEENPFEKFLSREVLNWFNHSKMVAFFHGNPMTNEDRHKAKILLLKQNMHLKNYGKKVVRLALENTHYETALQLFNTSTFIVFSSEPQVSRLLRLSKKMPQLILMAGIVEGKLLHKNELIRYSHMPDLETAQAQLVSVLNSASVRLRKNLIHHQQTLVNLLNQHVEMQQKTLDENEK